MLQRIGQWEDTPLDPNEDLSWLAGHVSPTEIARLRREQWEIRRDPVYQVVSRAGEAMRQAYLWEITRGGDSETFYVEQLCQCQCPSGNFDPDHPEHDYLGRCDELERCRWCVLLDELAEAYNAELKEQARKDHEWFLRAERAPQRVAELLAELYRGAS